MTIRVWATDSGEKLEYGKDWFSLPSYINREYSVRISEYDLYEFLGEVSLFSSKDKIEGRFAIYVDIDDVDNYDWYISFEFKEHLTQFKLDVIEYVS